MKLVSLEENQGIHRAVPPLAALAGGPFRVSPSFWCLMALLALWTSHFNLTPSAYMLPSHLHGFIILLWPHSFFSLTV